MRRARVRFDAEQFELNLSSPLPPLPPGPLQMGEVIEIRGERFRVQALRPRIVTLWRLPAADPESIEIVPQPKAEGYREGMQEEDVPF